MDRSWEYMDAHRNMNVEIGTRDSDLDTRAIPFLGIHNLNFFAVYVKVILKAINGIKCFFADLVMEFF